MSNTMPTRSLRHDRRLNRDESWLPLEVQARHHVGLASGWVTLGLIAVVFGAIATWAGMFEIPEITRGEGKVISRTQKQVIQSLEGGRLEEMMVHEGDLVLPGQAIVKIDPVQAQALYEEVTGKIFALRATKVRLLAEVEGREPDFPSDLKTMHPDIVNNEINSFKIRKKGVQDAVNVLKRNQQLIDRELEMLKPMVSKGAVSIVEVLRLERQSNELALQAEERVNRLSAEANAELLKVESDLAQFIAQSKARQSVVEHAVLDSPVKGIITKIHTHTVGGVISPGMPIVDITPIDDHLIIETKIKPSDIAFLRPGLNAIVKLTAYEYSKYGGLHGDIIHISSDTLEDTNAKNASQSEPYYQVYVKTKENVLKKGSDTFPIIPGMIATVEIETGKKTILEYFMKPLHKLNGALTER